MNENRMKHDNIKVGYGLTAFLTGGNFSLLQFAVYMFLVVEGGHYYGNATTMAYAFGALSNRKPIERVLRELCRKGFIHCVRDESRRGFFNIGLEDVARLNFVPSEDTEDGHE